MDNNELMHYGVLGMKWGARRNAAKAYSKAVKKQQKLNKNIDDAKASYTKAYNKTTTWASRRYKKLQAEADRYQSKANRKKYGWFPNKKKLTHISLKPIGTNTRLTIININMRSVWLMLKEKRLAT